MDDSNGDLMNRSIKFLLTAAVTAATAAGALLTGVQSASAADYGPDTCLQGYVWREATAGDHVCVTPGTRQQAADDNVQASARRSPTGGAYGPDTCLQGYVWRETTSTDHVCVTPSTRSQTSDDNRQASARRASLTIWINHWSPSGSCGSGCTTNQGGSSYIKVNGESFNVGRVWVGYYQLSTGRLIKGYWVDAKAHSGFAGGSFGLQTNKLDCGTGAPTAYLRAYDKISGRWSSRLNVRIGVCATL
jgi:hypothetical protein